MPRLDGTGPQGAGPATGWGRGSCVNGMRQRAFAGGFGYGCRRFISPKNELAALEDEEKMLTQELEAVREEKKALQKGQN